MGDNSAPAVTVIDARDLACPLPVLKLRKRLADAAPGSRWVLLATDPAAGKDVPAFCAAAGLRLLRSVREDSVLRFEIALADDQPGSRSTSR